jgi:hypothetical protein
MLRQLISRGGLVRNCGLRNDGFGKNLGGSVRLLYILPWYV